MKSELADRSNVFNIFKPRILPTGFVLGSNVDCFVILRNASYSQAMSLLHASVRQIYDPKSPSLLDDVYYDLYESITEDVWYEIEVVIKTTPELCVR